MPDITIQDVKDRFPNFDSETEDKITFAIEEGYSLSDVSRLATLYAIAHLLQVDADTGGGGGGVLPQGEVIETRVGPIMQKYNVTQAAATTEKSSSRQEFFSKTTYGLHMLALESRSVKAQTSVRIG